MRRLSHPIFRLSDKNSRETVASVAAGGREFIEFRRVEQTHDTSEIFWRVDGINPVQYKNKYDPIMPPWQHYGDLTSKELPYVYALPFSTDTHVLESGQDADNFLKWVSSRDGFLQLLGYNDDPFNSSILQKKDNPDFSNFPQKFVDYWLTTMRNAGAPNA